MAFVYNFIGKKNIIFMQN